MNRDKGFDSQQLSGPSCTGPDVLLVGETRDLETAKTAIEAALTGHLVLSTLHANDAQHHARLDEMGVGRSWYAALIASSPNGCCDGSATAAERVFNPLNRSWTVRADGQPRSNVTFTRPSPREGEPITPTCEQVTADRWAHAVLRINEEIALRFPRSTTDAWQPPESDGDVACTAGAAARPPPWKNLRMILTDSGLESERRARLGHRPVKVRAASRKASSMPYTLATTLRRSWI